MGNCLLQVVPVCVCAVPLLEPQPGVEVHVVEDEGDAPAPVVHVVHLAVLLHGHAGLVGAEAARAATAAKAPSVGGVTGC